jgi:uncharacterized protein YbbK (DUF523 family)
MENGTGTILISSCLVGMNTTYHGGNNEHAVFVEMLQRGEVIPVCPEQLGGLPTPRQRSEIKDGDAQQVINGNGRVIHPDGQDITSLFMKGAQEVLMLAQLLKSQYIIFKENSPSCGVHAVYDGTFREGLITGSGVTTALLQSHGFKVYSDRDYLDMITREGDIQ